MTIPKYPGKAVNLLKEPAFEAYDKMMYDRQFYYRPTWKCLPHRVGVLIAMPVLFHYFIQKSRKHQKDEFGAYYPENQFSDSVTRFLDPYLLPILQKLYNYGEELEQWNRTKSLATPKKVQLKSE